MIQISGSGVYFDVEAYGLTRYGRFAALKLPPTGAAEEDADAPSARAGA